MLLLSEHCYLLYCFYVVRFYRLDYVNCFMVTFQLTVTCLVAVTFHLNKTTTTTTMGTRCVALAVLSCLELNLLRYYY